MVRALIKCTFARRAARQIDQMRLTVTVVAVTVAINVLY